MDSRIPGFCGCRTIMVSTYCFQIHAGCLHSPNYDDGTIEDLTSHPHPHHHHHTVHIGTTGGPTHYNYNNNGDLLQNHHPHHHHHQNDVGVEKEKNNNNNNSKHHNNGNMASLLSFHNSTLHCDKVHGESYWVSFHEKSFHKGQHFKLYKGIINGLGPMAGLKCVVKVFANTHGTKELCKMESLKSEKFRELVRAFNKKLGKDNPNRLRATRSYWAPIDEVSKLKQLFFSGDKKLHIGEAVLFEQDVRVSDFSTKKCKVNTFINRSGRWCESASYSSVINAFIHFSHQYSNGEFVVCGLNGSKDDGGFFFSTPTIHSLSRTYGPMDDGERGFCDVIRNHTCSQTCQDLLGDTNFNIPTPTPTSPINIDIKVQQGNNADMKNDESESSRNDQKHQPMSSTPSFPQVFPEDMPDCNCNNGKDKLLGTSPVDSVDSISSFLMESGGFGGCDQFAEPSAPTMDEDQEDMMGSILQPPPYTPAQEARVALWIIGDDSRNAFVHFPPSSFLPCGSVTLGSSVECHHSGHTGRPTSDGVDFESAATQSTTATSATNIPSPALHKPDVNANFSCHSNHSMTGTEPSKTTTSTPAHDLKNAATTAPPTCNACPESNKSTGDAFVSNNNRLEQQRPSKQVRFEDPPPLSSSTPSTRRTSSSSTSPTAPSLSVFTGHSDDVTMDSCTNPSIPSSSPSLPMRFRSRLLSQNSSLDRRNNNNNHNNNSYNNSTHNNNNVSGNGNGNGIVGAGVDSNTNTTTDLPPPYDEHDVATANWLLSRSGLDMHSYRPPVLIRTHSETGGVVFSTHAINYHNNDNNNNNNNTHNIQHSNSGVFFSLSPEDQCPQGFNACQGRLV